MTENTHFGFEQVAEAEKARRVAQVFDSVAQRYDLMNDLMSGGLHRFWKAFTIDRSGVREWHVEPVRTDVLGVPHPLPRAATSR